MLEFSRILKHKIVNVAEFLVHNHGLAAMLEEDAISNKFVKEFNIRGLCVSTLGLAYFVHCAINLYRKVQRTEKNSRNYVAALFNYRLTYGATGMSPSEKCFVKGVLH